MARYTVLEIINKVLTKLGVDTVTAVNDTKFSTVLVEYLNNVCEDLSNHGDWPVMRHEQTYSITSIKRDYEASLAAGYFRNIKKVRVSGRQSYMRPEDPDVLNLRVVASSKGTPNTYTIISATVDNPVIRIEPMPDNNDNMVVTGFKVYQDLDVSAYTSIASLVPPWNGPLMVEGLHAKALWHEGGNTETPEFMIATKIYELSKSKEFARFTSMTDTVVQIVARS
jgi:hypothetical protein